MVKIVTDSTADLPPKVAQELKITIVPLYVHFGTEAYRDGVDLSIEEFYRKLASSKTLPTTSTPSPEAFAEVYNKLAEESDEIISIHISSKLSATYNVALLGRDMVKRGCRVEIMDSLSTSMGLGLLAISAAKEAQIGTNLEQIIAMLRQAIPRTHFLA